MRHKKTGSFHALAIVLGLAGATTVLAQEDYSTWNHYKNVVVNTRASGADVTDTLRNYPLLVRLGASESAIFSQAGTDGASLRFTKTNGTTRLHHEIEHWDAGTQTASIWVLADTIFGNDSAATVRMYWGKAGAADSSRGTAVFDTANNFKAVWHLNETASPSMDATILGSPANWKNDPTSVAGVSGRAINFANLNPAIVAPPPGQFLTSQYNPTTQNFRVTAATGLTLSAWVWRAGPSVDAANNVEGIAGRYQYSGGNWRQYMLTVGADGQPRAYRGFTSTNGSNTTTALNSSVTAVDSSWQHVVMKATGTNQEIYVDGILRFSTTTNITTSLDNEYPNAAFTIGRMDSAAQWSQYFNGSVDEVRLSRGMRSAGWTKLDFETQKPATAAVMLGATVDQVAPTPPANLRYVASPTGDVDTLVFVQGAAANVFPSYTGGPVDSIKIIGTATLPTGLSFNTTTGAITGTPTATFNAANRTIRAYGVNDSTTRVVRISAVAGLSNLRYVSGNTTNTDTLRMQTGVAVNVMPTVTGPATDSFAITSGATSLPAGVTLNTATGAITGTPTATFTGTRTITAFSSVGTTARSVRMEVVLGPTSSLMYSRDTVSTAVGTAMTSLVPSWAGRTPETFSVTPALPAGLGIHPVTGIISGTPTATVAAANYTVRAANATDTATKVVRLATTAVNADGDYASAWSGHASITLNTTATGANVPGNVTNFPVLVRLGSADSAIFSAAHATGRDIRFTKNDNTTRLHHEIDHWDATARRAAIWVRVDTVRGNNATQTIRMHWGNSTAPSLSDGNAVFDTASGYVSVWHLGGDTSAHVRHNSVRGGHPAVPRGSSENLASGWPKIHGVIGLADTLRGQDGTNLTGRNSNDHLNIGRGYNNFGGKLTVSMWAYSVVVSNNEWQQYLSMGNHIVSGTSSNVIWMGRQGNGNHTFTSEIFTGSANHTHSPADGITPGAWNHLVWTVDDLSHVMYRDGAQIATSTKSAAITDIVRDSAFIGRAGGWGDRNTRGVFDEVRISRVARSADYVKLSFENQKAAQTLVTLARDTIVSVAAAQLQGPALSAKAVTGGIQFQANAARSGNLKVEVLDMHGRTVWSRTLEASAGRTLLTWNAASGAGIYVVRMSLATPDGANARLLRKIPITR